MRDQADTRKSMSFGDSVKEELLSALPTAACCRRSFLHGLLVNAENGIAGMVMCRLRGDDVAGTAKKLLAEQYGRTPDERAAICYGRKIITFEFESRRLAAFLAELSDAPYGGDIPELKCTECGGYFTAGVLASSARLCDPEKSVRLEIGIPDPARAARLASFFRARGAAPIISHRSGSCSLIFKKSADVQDILSYAGAQMSAMALIQADLLREFRGNINRASNCEVRNIGRSVNAASAQLEAIARLKEEGLFAGLPEELRETAELREKEPECSIAELAARHSPPISKSGVNHRLRKICEAADKIKKK